MPTKTVQRAQALEKIVEHMLMQGLSATSLRQLAMAAGTSDRMLLYYFKDKEDVITSALAFVADGLLERLNEAIGPSEKLSTGQLFQKVALLAAGSELQPHMRLFLEIAIAAARGDTPYVDSADMIIEGFTAWLEARLDIDDAKRRRQIAAMILATIDGLALLNPFMNGNLKTDAYEALQGALGD